MSLKVNYNLKIRNVKDVTPETIVDVEGKTQADHNRENRKARNKLDAVQRLSLDNKAKISEVEKLSIKQQTEIDFLKNTPTQFDLAETELFINEYGTINDYMINGNPNSEILKDVLAEREDGNFELGVLKNPRTKYAGGIDKIASAKALFGSKLRDIHYGEKTRSLWVVTSDGAGQRGYLYRCSPTITNGTLEILGYWILNKLSASKEFTSVAESYYNGTTTLFVGVSDTSGSSGGHYLNRYRINHNTGSNVVTIADGKKINSEYIYHDTGDILDNEVTTDQTIGVERVDLSEPGKMSGIEIVNDTIFILVREDQNDSEEEIDSTGYSFIRSFKITELGVIQNVSEKYKLDDIFEDKLNADKPIADDATIYDAYGITAMRTVGSSVYENLTQTEANAAYDANPDAKYLFIAAQQRNTPYKKKIVLLNIDNINSEDAVGNENNYNEGLINNTRVLYEMVGFSNGDGNSTSPFIASAFNGSVVEVSETSDSGRRVLAVHDTSGFDIFQGSVRYSAKVKRYFNLEHFHAQLNMRVLGVSLNQTQAITACRDNEFSFLASSQTYSRTVAGGMMENKDVFNFHEYYGNEPKWSRPNVSFYVDNGSGNDISGTVAVSIYGNPASGSVVYVAHKPDKGAEQYELVRFDINDAISGTPYTGVDGQTQYTSLSSTVINLSNGNMGTFTGPVACDPVKSKVWVASSLGYVKEIGTSTSVTLNHEDGDMKVVKLYGSTSGEIVDSSQLTALAAYNDMLYVAQYMPNYNSEKPKNTIIRIFDVTRSTSQQPFSTDQFVVPGIVRDIDVSDSGMYITTRVDDGDIGDEDKASSNIKSIYIRQFDNDVFESTEVLDEFNFFKNTVDPGFGSSHVISMGYNVTASEFMKRDRDSDEYQKREWVLPRKSMAFGLSATSAYSLDRGKLMIIDISDVNNPLAWAEFSISNTNSATPNLAGISGSLLHGSGNIVSLTGINDKLFIGRNDSGYGTMINVIDFAKSSAHLIVNSHDGVGTGSGTLYSGMQFGYKNVEEDKTGTLNERNNPLYHYSGFVNTNINVAHPQITSMDSAYVKNTVNENITTPYVIVGHTDSGDGSGCVDIINGNTFESASYVGRGRGSVKKVVINSDGSALVAVNDNYAGSGEVSIWKIKDIRTVTDYTDYVTDFSAQEVVPYYPTEGKCINITDMKVLHYKTKLGEEHNMVYATFADTVAEDGSGRTYAVKFDYETVAEAGGGVTNPAEFNNNVEVIYYTEASAGSNIKTIDFMDDRIFLGFTDEYNKFKMAIVKKFAINPDTGYSAYKNNYFPILGDNGMIASYVDYNDLYYQGVKSPIQEMISVRENSLMFASTTNGSVLFKFPFVTSSSWFSTMKQIDYNINAVALARDVFTESSYLSEVITRNDDRIEFTSKWTDETAGTTVAFDSPLFNKATGKKQIGGKLVKADGSTFEATSYYKYKPFTVASDNNIAINWDGSNITSNGYDYKDNVLMIFNDEPLPLFEFFDIQTASFKPLYDGKKFATVSLNDANTTMQFVQTASGTISNENANQYDSLEINFNVSQSPVVTVYAYGKQLATFNSIDGTINDTLASTQKPLIITRDDGTVVPVDRIITKGKNGRAVKRLRLTTWNNRLRERLYPEITESVVTVFE